MFVDDTNRMPPHILVLGLGNMLLRDEGAGIYAIDRLVAKYRLPAEVETMDGGTLGLFLLPYLDGVTDLLIIDCVLTDRPPGTLVRLEGEAIPATLSMKMSVHQVGLQELLVASRLQGSPPARVVVWGIEPDLVEPGLEVSPVVAAQLDTLVDAVAQELRDWGVAVKVA